MSTTERKARKRAGIPFQKAPKVGTPLIERQGFRSLSKLRQTKLLNARGIKLSGREAKKLDQARPNRERHVRNFTR
ncbi:hypothetical protein MN032_10810 [Agromyces atrinae]|uniref:hypothetical protein n=1 Tax=Agromyces atrinae TaxID=592376 RepID=UPI001F56C907|nr:hypothetical protein [Agromyces atrinae]MCI2958187.1 hypothetical protein [Agromyces atrinae]